MVLKSADEVKAYYAGIRKGAQLFAWWKDGVQYVGTCGETLAFVWTDFERLEQIALAKIMKGHEVNVLD